ncbi:MAG: SemiSWEET transporter [Cytophagales bacterium]|nr:SemiSWEET transporter [Cytophagales bacterium]
MSFDLIGTLAAICTTVSFLPQAWQVYKTKNTDAISLAMYLIFNIGIVLWLCYGILIHSTPIIYSNVITFVFAFYILMVKISNLPKK